MLPDTGERYLSTILFEEVPEEMTEQEYELSRSTPNYRFDAAPPPPDNAKERRSRLSQSPKRSNFSKRLRTTMRTPWSCSRPNGVSFPGQSERYLRSTKFPIVRVDLDSVAYQVGQQGRQNPQGNRTENGLKTVPQIYVGGKHIGGCHGSL